MLKSVEQPVLDLGRGLEPLWVMVGVDLGLAEGGGGGMIGGGEGQPLPPNCKHHDAVMDNGTHRSAFGCQYMCFLSAD